MSIAASLLALLAAALLSRRGQGLLSLLLVSIALWYLAGALKSI